jgi:hypothetical protein
MRTASGTTPAIAPWGRWDRMAMWWILAGSIVYALIVLSTGVARLVHQLSTRTWSGALIVDEPLPRSADGGTASLLNGRYENATVTLGDLSDTAFGLLTTGLVFSVVTTATVALAFVYLSWRLLRSKPFKKSLSIAFLTAGTALLIGTMLSIGFEGLGRMIVASELVGEDTTEGFWPIAAQGDLGPIGFGLALLIVACAFEYGERLSRETDGLV